MLWVQPKCFELLAPLRRRIAQPLLILMPRGRRPPTAARTSLGARKASEMNNGDAHGIHYTQDMVQVGFAESPENIAKTAHAGWLIQV